MKTHTLTAQKREITGKKVKQLRKKGVVPGNIFGKTVASTAVSINVLDFKKTYHEVGETGLIELSLKGEKTPHYVLVNLVQIHPVTDEVLHVDLHEVALKEKIRVAVPITFSGESPATSQKKGVLITLLNEIEVEALPTELPDHIMVDLTSLSEVGDEIKISDIKLDTAKVKVLAEPTEVIARINELEKEEAPAPVTVPTEGEAVVAPTAEGAPAPTPAAPTTPAKPEGKKE